jgi:ribosomal protein S18 acetylase RimI-like enzyme
MDGCANVASLSSNSSVVQRFQSAWSILFNDGPLRLGRELVKRIATFETYAAFRFDLANEIPPAAVEIPLSIRRATETDFAEFRSLPYPFRRHAQLHDRYGIDECHLAFSQGAIAHLAWVYYPHELSKHPTPFRILRRDEAAIANCVTIREFRGKGVYPAVIRALLEDLKQQGYRYCYMYIEVRNTASVRGVSKLGFAPVGKSWRLRLFFHTDPAAGFYFRGRCR